MSTITNRSLYYKNRYRKFIFSIPRDDLPRLIVFVEALENKTDYFINLVENDMMHKGVEPDEAFFTVSDRTDDK